MCAERATSYGPSLFFDCNLVLMPRAGTQRTLERREEVQAACRCPVALPALAVVSRSVFTWPMFDMSGRAFSGCPSGGGSLAVLTHIVKMSSVRNCCKGDVTSDIERGVPLHLR